MKKLLYTLSVAGILCIGTVQQGCDGDPELVEPVVVPNIENLKMNELQAIGSHNSYRIKTYAPMLVALIDGGVFQGNDPLELDYTHEPLITQFNSFNIRSMELDIYYDPNGGAYYDRAANPILISEPADSQEPELLNPGMKLLHIIDIDYMTHHLTFVSALDTIKDWSDANPNHLPLIVIVEAKEQSVLTQAIPYTSTAFDELDMELESVFGPGLGQVVTPDDFKGAYSTPNEAAMAGAWPTLAQSRGTIYFVLMLSSSQKTDYLSGHQALAGRNMFIFGDPGNDETAFTKVDDPVGTGNQDTIQSLVQAGYMVRTRCDVGTWQSRNGDYSRMQMAFSSGAQILSTDYYRPDERASTDPDWSDYSVALPDNVVARLNPVNGPQEYQGILIND